MSGPCHRPQRPLPAGLFVGRKPLCGGPNVNLSGRCGGLRRWCHLHLSIRMCHDIRSSGILADKISVSLTTKRVNHIVRVTPHPFWRVLAAGAPRRPPELGAVAAPSSGARFLPLSRIVQGITRWMRDKSGVADH